VGVQRGEQATARINEEAAREVRDCRMGKSVSDTIC
jgi:hypothetical protein